MTLKKTGFRIRTVYKVRKPRILTIAKQKLSFMVASLSLVAFVMGNMVGQHGWYAFWKTVLGAEDDAMIAFVGTVSPIAKIPDYQQWAKYGGSKELHTFTQVPRDVLRDLPSYDVASITGNDYTLAKQAYSTMWAGGYNTVQGSHPGVDIDAPRGTPVVAIANGIVEKVSMQSHGFGHHIMIRHPNVPDGDGTTTLYSTYAHLDAVLVSEGMVVHKGQNIGTVGNTGLVFGATGYHLYFQIDVADAPFHPYWPFTSTEIASAGMSFMKAVDSTAYQDRLYQYTLNPMAFVEKYESYVRPVIAQGASSSARSVRSAVSDTVTGSKRLRMLSSERARVRMARAGITRTVASSSSSRTVVADVGAISSSVSSSQPAATIVDVVTTASLDTSPTTVSSSSDVDHLTIQHSGTITNTWQKVTIRTVDANGDTVTTPSFRGRLYIIPEFGEATIRPSELSPLDFVNGVATVNVLSRSTKTLFIATRGAFTTVSAPMISVK